MAYQSTAAWSITLHTQVWERVPPAATPSYGYEIVDSLEFTPLDAAGDPLASPIQLGSYDAGVDHWGTGVGTFNVSFYAGSAWTGDCCGFRLHHRDPGEALPFTWAVAGVSWVGGSWSAASAGSTEKTPTYEPAPIVVGQLDVLEGSFTAMSAAVYSGAPDYAWSVSPNQLSGEEMDLDLAWVAAEYATVGVHQDMPNPSYTMRDAVPLGDLVVMLLAPVATTTRRYVRRIQSQANSVRRIQRSRAR